MIHPSAQEPLPPASRSGGKEVREVDVVDVYPLAPMQEAMLLHGRGSGGAGHYVQQFICTLHEPLGLAVFRRAWQHLADRHPVLRTSFDLDAFPEPLQRVHARVDVPWTKHDWRHLPAELREERMGDFLRQDRLTPFDPARAPLMRFTLIHTGEEAYRLVWTSHHALLDGYARRILLREVFEEYESLLEGREFAPAAPQSYREYVGWLRQAEPSASRGFWKETLRGFDSPNELSLEPGEGESERRERYRFRLAESLTTELQRLAQREEITLNTVLQGAWALLVSRYTGDHDIVFGATRACRRGGPSGATGIVGLLSNTVPVRVRVEEERSVAEYLGLVRSLWVAMRPHERAHLARIQEWSEVPNGTPLFETLLGFETDTAQDALHRLGGGWERRTFDLLQWISYPLAVVAHGGASVSLQIVYDPTRFGEEAIRRMGKHLTHILCAFAESTEQQIRDVDLLTPAERSRLLGGPNGRGTTFLSPLPVHRLFEEQAARTPDAVAVVFGDRRLTYGELDRRANRLAHHLRELGAGLEARIGLCVEPSVETVVGILGILKAGATYVPLDPHAPRERIAFMAEDAGLQRILTQRMLAERMGELPVPVWFPGDLEEDPGVEAQPEHAPTVEVTREHLAYVIYTSGSTGKPKGVQVTHGNVVHLFSATRELFGFGAGDVWTLFHSFAFDFSVWEIWGALLHGGRLVVIPYPTSRSPEEFYRLLVQEQVTVLNQTPSAFRQLMAAGERLGPASELALRTVIFGGEALEPVMLRRWMDRHGEEKPRLVNMYGITETTVHVTYRPVTRADVERGARSPVGVPIPDLQVYVLDSMLRPVPVGVPGEMFVGGSGVARGYLGRPALTAQRFVPDPFSPEPGTRMYRSGDRARRLAAGELEFLGRLDEQVKIRGFRIELGEIEAVLRAHPGVDDCAVVVREETPGDRRLAGYIVAAEGARPPMPGELRAYAGTRLPEYMIPTAFMTLPGIPLTVNGKLDRRSLPAPGRTAPEDDYVSPRTPTEEILAGIWAEVLGVERVGAEDDFFALGGHSLLATRVAVRARKALRVELPLHALFDAPTVGELAGVVEAMRAEGRGGRDTPPIHRGPRDGGLPLSFAQERLWFLHRLHPGSAAYNVPALFRLEGLLDVAALQRSLEVIVARHEALRTTFRGDAGEPRQYIHPPAPFPLPTVDLGTLPGGEPHALRLAEDEARRPFDLERGPLVRALLLRLDPGSHLLLVSLHHIVGDGESIGILTRELGACYGAYAVGREPALPELPVQYADYARWQRENLTEERLGPALAYWCEQLAGTEPPALPVDRVRPGAPHFRGRRHAVSFPAPLALAVREFARAAQATPFMVLLAAFKALLARYSGQEEVVVASPVAGREPAEVEGLIGFFVNTLMLRTRTAMDEGFRALLERVRETTLRGYEHRHAPFERVVAERHSDREAGVPLSRVMFAFRNTAGETCSLSGLDVHRVPVERGAAKFDLMLSLQEASVGVEGAWEYDAELFEHCTVERLAEHFARLLEGALSAPDAPLADLPLLSGAERREVLGGSAGPTLPITEPLPVHRLFAAQVARTPGAPAVVFRERSLTYAELDHKSNQLAHALRERGVGPEMRVALCVQRGVEAIVGILGVLKAGGAYVPLDPGYPAGWLSAILEECEAQVVLTVAQMADRLPVGSAEVLRLDADWPRIAQESDDPPAERTRPENAAYVIYTSGSTGTPKGVVVQHRSLQSLAEALRRAIYDRRNPAGPARVTINGPLTFDTSVKQLVQLFSGCTLYVVPEEVRYDGRALAAFLRKNAVEVLDCTPAQLRLLLAGSLLEEVGPALTDVLVAGEAIDEPTWKRLAAVRGVAFHNLYGPTECTVDATACAVRDFPGAPVIGRPLCNVRAYVLDDRLNPTAYGVPGELYVAGEGVARGYLGRSDLTAGCFLPDPFAPVGGERMYRTGDRVRQRADGILEFLGRVDEQVKIRGYRIEPGEVEAVLAQHPGVRECVVVAREDVPGDRRLVAYMVGHGGRSPEAAELREHLAGRLPAYMVPAAFVALEALPVTYHGKIDHRALPAPGASLSTAGYIRPRTATEEVLAGIWAEVLGVEHVGVEDDFFHLGGHSLRVARVVSRVREALGVELPLSVAFETPTVLGVARWVEAARRAGEIAGTAPVRRVPRDRPLPLSFAQRRLWLVDQLDPGSPAYNMPLVLRLRGRLDVPALRHSLGEIVRRHEVLRTRLAGSGVEAEQRVESPGPVPLPVLDLCTLPEPDQEGTARRLLEEEAVRPFDLATGPLLRARLLRLAPAEHLLSLTLHHIAGDGWSTEILLREMGALYGAFSRGSASPLPELPIQYGDYAVWQRERLDGDALEPMLAYWRGKLAGAPPLLDLPTDRPRPANPGARAATRSVVVPPELVQALRALSRQEESTVFVTLLAGFQALLGRYADQEDVVVGIPVANRAQVEMEALIGFFINTLPLRTDLSGDPTVRELLARVRRSTLQAQAHGEVPFERLVEEQRPASSARHSPLFQVLFALQSAEEMPRIPGLDAERLEVSTGVAKYDLALVVEERGEKLSASLSYRTELYDGDTIERMLMHLLRVLERMAAEPEGRVWELALVDEEERRFLVGDGGGTQFAPGASVHELFALQAAATPDRTAVVCGGRTLTYGELDRRANRLAHHLRRHGASADSLIALCMERSPELIVGMLGVLKAGAAYLPIDPSAPRERIALILMDASAPLVLTQDSLLGRLPAHTDRIIRLDGGWPEMASEPAEAPRVGVAPESLAYAIFTSGSTGKPKGVLVPHRGLTNLVQWHRSAFRVTGADRATHLAGLGFDASVWEVWPYLTSGASLYLVPDEEVRSSPTALQSFLLGHGITIGFAPTPLAEGVLVLDWPQDAPLRVLLTGGDALHVHPGPDLPFTFVNNYGPTECAVVATSGILPAQERRGGAPTIGRAIDGARAYVLDARMWPVPVGVPGELYIGGVGVARGYLGRPELTAERFAPDPFAGRPGARMYRTGDRARWRADGALEFLGRIDRQVKIRGFRIELGEVETLLHAHPQVREAVAAVWEEVLGDPRLVAYVVRVDGTRPAAPELRGHLGRYLPEYMLPTAFVVLEALPLTPNGKVDRRALPAPNFAAGREWEYMAPRTPTEELLAGIWAKVLCVERVGVRDNFFELGGHSLLAVRLVSCIRRETGIRVPLHAFVAGATVEELAELVLNRVRLPVLPPLVPIRRGGARRPFFCVHALDGHVLSYASLANCLGEDRPFYGLQALGVDGEAPLDRVEDMAASYITAIRTVQSAGPYALGGWSMGGVLAFEMARQLHTAGEETDVLVLFDAPRAVRREAEDETRFLIETLRHMLDGQPPSSFSQEDYQLLPPGEQVEYLRAEAVRAGILADGSDAGRLQDILRVRRVHLHALRSYRPERFPGRALLIEAAERPALVFPTDRAFVWESLCTRGVELHRFAGNHFTLLQEPSVLLVAEQLKAHLSRAEQG